MIFLKAPLMFTLCVPPILWHGQKMCPVACFLFWKGKFAFFLFNDRGHPLGRFQIRFRCQKTRNGEHERERRTIKKSPEQARTTLYQEQTLVLCRVRIVLLQRLIVTWEGAHHVRSPTRLPRRVLEMPRSRNCRPSLHTWTAEHHRLQHEKPHKKLGLGNKIFERKRLERTFVWLRRITMM